MYLLIAKFVEKSCIYPTIYFILPKNILKQTWNSFIAKFGPQLKYGKNSYQTRQFLAIFSNLTTLTLGYNSVKGLRVTKIAKETKFEAVWSKLKSKTGFQRQSVTKYFRLTLVYTWNRALRKIFNFYFSIVFW